MSWGGNLIVHIIVDVGCGNALKLVKLFPQFEIIGIDHGDNLVKCRNDYNFGTWIECDFEKSSEIDLPKDILKKSIIVCADVIEHLANPTSLLMIIKKLMDVAPFCLLSTPERDVYAGKDHFGPPANPHHVREWNITEFKKLLNHYKLNLVFIGLTVSNDRDNKKETIIAGIGNNESPNDIIDVSKWVS